MHLDELARRAMALAGVPDAEGEGGGAAAPRVILAIAGSPGSGKTTLATALVDRINSVAGHPFVAQPSAASRQSGRAGVTPRLDDPPPHLADGHLTAAGKVNLAGSAPQLADPTPHLADPTPGLGDGQPVTVGVAVHLPMDGLHLANATLDALGRHDRKGAIDTFDGWGYLGLVRRLVAERDHAVYAPGFDRRIDEPVAGQVAVTPDARLIVVEGNYLLADEPPWSLARALYAECWFVATPEDERMRRLVARHIRFGRTEAAARRWAESVDGANAALIEPTAAVADLVIDHLDGLDALDALDGLDGLEGRDALAVEP